MAIMIPGARERYENGGMPDPKTFAEMGKYNEELSRAGVLLALAGLHPPAKSARIAFKGGKATVRDGPFTEARELIGGYWLWQVKSKEEALEWAKRCPAEDGDTIELRQVFEMSDFGPEVESQEASRSATIHKNMDANTKT